MDIIKSDSKESQDELSARSFDSVSELGEAEKIDAEIDRMARDIEKIIK